MMHARRLIAIVLAGLLACLPGATASAAPDAYPSRPIRIVVPFGPGNQLDVFARLVGDRLAIALNQPVIVENHAGAAGNVASEVVARAAPDGYTLLVSGVLITLLPLTYGTRAVDPAAAFAPISRLAQQPIRADANLPCASPHNPASTRRRKSSAGRSSGS